VKKDLNLHAYIMPKFQKKYRSPTKPSAGSIGGPFCAWRRTGVHGLLVQPMEDGLYSTGLGGGLTIGFVMREASYLLFLLAVFFFGVPWWPSMYYTLSCLDLLNCAIIN
jgi:hypothetical protein